MENAIRFERKSLRHKGLRRRAACHRPKSLHHNGLQQVNRHYSCQFDFYIFWNFLEIAIAICVKGRYTSYMNKAFVFDFDDTLCRTFAKISVKRNGELIKLDSQEFAEFKSQENDDFCFAEFKLTQHIENGIMLGISEFAKVVANEGHSVYVLSARSSVVKLAIQNKLENYGIKVAEVFTVGDKGLDIAKYKQEVLVELIAKHTEVYFYDDDKRNVDKVANLGLKAKIVK